MEERVTTQLDACYAGQSERDMFSIRIWQPTFRYSRHRNSNKLEMNHYIHSVYDIRHRTQNTKKLSTLSRCIC
jgi:hypothetical protein